MGRLYQVLSSCYRIQSKELSTDEENDLRKSISYYKKAAEIVSKDMMSLKENLTWDMVNVLLRLATLYQENPPLSRLSVKESERKLIEILDTAEKHSSMLLKNTQNSERIYLRLAEINYRIAAMHHGHIVDSDISGKTLNHSIRLSLKYYQNSIENFNRVEWEEQNLSWCLLFLRASVEFTALIKNHKSNKSRFSEGLEIFKKSKKCIERLNCINPQYSDEMTKTTIKILSMVLMEIKKNISQFKNFTDKELNEIILICMRSKGEVENILNVLKKLESLEN
jgi:tetratricopeptide (TPR) repeat protein